ncbi:MAG: carboxypeptidase regulatory-like domain-containing protein [Candidatus Solibacter usitatus]|nr:carboxypeptidase regulatory-like domain-containing protein [Candidatus Solibacter usitatus]
MLRKLLLGVLFSSIGCLSLAAQEARGGIQGRVTDPSGGVVPGAKVAVTNTQTNDVRRVLTNETGYYEVNFLEPSTYAVMVEASGFKKVNRTGLEVQVGSKMQIDLTLEVGAVAETVEVTASAPLLETTSASGGRVLDNRELVNLPFSDLNPFALSALAPGMMWTGQPEYRRPFDNAGTSAFNTMGGVGQNEYTVDGMSVTGTGRRVGFVPPADSVGEFKLETSNFDASQGFTSGAAINVSSKSGTNSLHGSVFDQHFQQRWNATPFFTRESFDAGVRNGAIDPSKRQKQTTGRSNNYGLSASGPVYIPKILNGKNKLFWTFTWNGIRQSKAETTSDTDRSVPTDAMKQGDFSYFLTVPNGASRFTIYDPRSARLVGTTVTRTPFPGNKGVPILNPTYAYYSKLYPAPNNVPGKVTAEMSYNYFASGMPKDEKFNSIVNRYDAVLTQNHRLNVRWQWNDRLADEYDWTYETARGLHSNGLTRINRGGNVGYLWTINSNNIFDTNFGISRFEEGSRNTTRSKIKAADVGLPAYIDQRAGAYTQLPRLDFGTLSDVGGGYAGIDSKSTTYEYRAAMTTIQGAHSFKYGWQERRNFFASGGAGSSTGYFSFDQNLTRATNIDNLAARNIHEWAAFMMGLPSNGVSIDSNDSAYWRTPRRALFFQDDWRVTSKLHVSMGLRWEQEGGTSERFNRGISAVFLNQASPITSMVQQAYAASPVPELPASKFTANGMTSYLGKNGYDTATGGVMNWLPKLGIVYSLNNKTVIRGGFGMYADTLNVSNDRPSTAGFNQPTSTALTNDSGLTFCCGVDAIAGLASGRTPMNDPFPVRPASGNTRFDNAYRSTLDGVALYNTDLTALPWNYRPALQNRWRVGVQREIARNLLLDVSYNGSYSYIPVLRRINYLPAEFWTKGMVRDQNNDNFLNANFPNPYNIRNLSALQQSDPTLYRFMSGQGFYTGANMARNRLLRNQYSMYNNFRMPGLPGQGSHNGYVNYKDLQILVERRFTKGFQSSFMYTMAFSRVADWIANEYDINPTERPNNNVLPHRIAWTAVYETPFGKGRTYVKDGPLSYLIGNWNVSWVYQLQSGPATGDWGNRFFYGDQNQLETLFKSGEMRSQDIRKWFDPSIRWTGATAPPAGYVGFEGRAAAQPGSYHQRVFPIRLDSLRADGIMNLDLKVERMFPIKPERGINARFSVDLLNATNHTNFSGPQLDPTNSNFGYVTSQRGLSRVIQFNLRFDF